MEEVCVGETLERFLKTWRGAVLRPNFTWETKRLFQEAVNMERILLVVLHVYVTGCRYRF